jgi:AdoMet-dependent heme synthase
MKKYTFNTIFYEATRRCNLSCTLCMSSSNNKERVRESVKKELTTAEIEKHVLATAHEIGVKVMTWSGGEFILRKDALQLVKLATKYGYESSICTNGISMTEEKLKAFDDAAGGSLVIAVGINSIDNENAWTRDTDCNSALKVLDLCGSLGIKRHCVVNIGKHNIKTIAKTLEWLEKKGIPYNRSPFTARGSGCGHFKDLGFTREEMERVFHPELRRHPNGYISYTPFFLSPELHEHFAKGHKNVSVPQNPSIGCFCGTWLGISAEGNVSPCGILMDVLDCGNVREKTLQEIIDESPVFQAILDRSKLKGKCGRCRYQYTCGGCRAMAFFHKGDYMEEDPTCFFDPKDPSEKSPHEDETNKMFKRYVFMVRHAGRNMLKKKDKPSAGQAP